ncbi:DegT/DnrJ/EryC1/StrS family aminotransferase [Thermoflexus sp.]|uniref:DegT/DnrJ/EryC1/StrS family aminotransferase n=2 Tax=Thermoflexus sp. TaxID=1969742 RepID=UPI0025DEA7C1|nr:DegT/DnrJ/EryC1/StrS family aminotransferase [Thermoflexus sp.]MCS7350269.1 DegT/DnrJ/EryC1/StrS family aminotransferase [Thermoflexus sp.]MDW8179720.1 DegT/DnrJ/EryC1/StrS family aminotransferase [Anaerolineae bacterium]
MKIPMARPLFDEETRQALLEVLNSGRLAQGLRVLEFEERFAEWAEVPFAIAVSNGTAALLLALMALEIGPEDEVITTPFTFAATANVILFLGARPVFADIQPSTLNLDPGEVERRITSRTRAIILVHLYGNPCEMEAFTELAERHGLALIEDAAHAPGALYRGQPVGSFGIGCFSFYATKNITTGEGGMITTQDPRLARRLRMLRDHGQSAKYVHEILGLNFRMTELQAALGIGQLQHIEAWNARRRAIAAFYTQHLRGVNPVETTPNSTSVYHLYTVRLAPGLRDAVRERLREVGVETGIHYPTPVYRQPLYQRLGYNESLPVAEAAAREVLSLPIHPALQDGEIRYVVEAMNAAIEDLGGK